MIIQANYTKCMMKINNTYEPLLVVKWEIGWQGKKELGVSIAYKWYQHICVPARLNETLCCKIAFKL